jgi:hypothetical protein
MVPGEDSACDQEQPLAGLELQAPDVTQVIQIGGQQWSIWIGWCMSLG